MGVSQSKTESSPRWATFDLARLVAIYSIVWLHAVRLPALENSKALGRFAVPFFVFASVFFAVDGLRRHPERSWGAYIRSRLVRIYLPFLAWSGIYLAMKLVKAGVLPEQANVFPGWSVFWAGSFYHLWFMPFIFVATVTAFGLGKLVLERPALETGLSLICLTAGLAWALTPNPTEGSLASGRGESVNAAIPAACWAMVFVLAYRGPVVQYLKHPASLMLAVMVLVVATAWVWRCGPAKLAVTLAGLAFMVLAMGPSVTGSMVRLSRFGPLAYGIYLSHLLFIKILESVAAKLDMAMSGPLDVTVFVASALLSTLLAWSLSRRRATRWLAA